MKKNKETTNAYNSPASLAIEAKNVEREEALKKEKRKKNKGLEILRFVVIGVLCTILDFCIQFVLMKWAFAFLIEKEGWWEYLAWGLSVTIAFIIANIVNFVFSRLWVYQNVDKKINTKSFKTFLVYFGLGAGGWLIGLALQELGVLICNSFFPDLKLTYDFTKVNLLALFEEGAWAFWAFCIIFAIKTIVTMFYNYITRKRVIFKEPKGEEEPFLPLSNEEPLVVTAQEEIEKTPKYEGPRLITRSSFIEILREEIDAFYGKPQQKVYVSDAKRLIHEELEIFEREHSTKKQ